MDKTGYALGRLNPILYYENSRGDIVLPPTTEDGRYFYQQRGADGTSYRDRGYELREAGTLAEIDVLQKRLVTAEMRKMGEAADKDERISAKVWAERGFALRQRMMSSSTTPYERDFIELYLQLREEKRAKHRQRWTEAQMYLWAREMDSKASATDRIKS